MDKKPKISVIAAIQKNDRGLGKNNKLLSNIPADLKRFKTLTSGHPIIMGRKTFESIGRPLPNRTNIVITTNKEYSAPGCVVCNSLEEALSAAAKIDTEEIFIIGGEQIYKMALPLAGKLYLTIVETNLEADTFFPDYSAFKTVVHEEKHLESLPSFSFIDLEK